MAAAFEEGPTEVGGVIPGSRVLVIGVGNAYRHDDAAGLVVARHLKDRAPSSCEVHEQVGEGTALMELWKCAQRVVVVDAVQSGAIAGTVHRFNVNLHSLPAPVFRGSTHAFGLNEAVELSRVLRQLPSNFIIYGIEGHNFDAGIGLSSAVLHAVNELVEKLREEVETT